MPPESRGGSDRSSHPSRFSVETAQAGGTQASGLLEPPGELVRTDFWSSSPACDSEDLGWGLRPPRCCALNLAAPRAGAACLASAVHLRRRSSCPPWRAGCASSVRSWPLCVGEHSLGTLASSRNPLFSFFWLLFFTHKLSVPDRPEWLASAA